ncbi:MAG: alpha/beta hydrolase [Thermoanaerobaculia bacterium]|nr:alpha/beta hydrolase [Thermoanaerobaculia bacterium]
MLDAVAQTSHRAAVNGVGLHYVEAGTGPLVVLLHGFPEFWYSWRNQIPALANAGFRVVAPDLRGYNESSKPDAVGDYRITTVAADIAALIESLGAPCVLGGHDWGGLAAWTVAMTRPELLRKLVILNMPHPVPLSRELRRSMQQKLRLAYQLFLQPPRLPELMMRAILPLMMRTAGRFTSAEIVEYRRAWARPGARRAMANYYRAVRRHGGELRKIIRPIEMPVLMIWGENDPVFMRATTEDFDEYVPNLRIVRIADAGHFVQTDEPELVSDLMIEFAR